jgi:hypothetical protein
MGRFQANRQLPGIVVTGWGAHRYHNGDRIHQADVVLTVQTYGPGGINDMTTAVSSVRVSFPLALAREVAAAIVWVADQAEQQPVGDEGSDR